MSPLLAKAIMLIGKDTGGFCIALSAYEDYANVRFIPHFRSSTLNYQGHSSRRGKRLGNLSSWVRIFLISRASDWPFLKSMYAHLASLLTLPRKMRDLVQCSALIVSSIPSGIGDFLLIRKSRKLGLPILLVTHGSDSRPLYLDGNFRQLARSSSKMRLSNNVARQSSRVKKAEKLADRTLTWRGASHFFVNDVYFFEDLGFPVINQAHERNLAERSQRNRSPHQPLVAFHAPTSKGGKGTLEIQKVVDQLNSEGNNIELRVLSGVSNSKILEEIADCDLVIDQLYSDNLCGVFAREAGYCAKPVLVAGESLESVALGLENEPPTIRCRPEDFREALETLAYNADKLKEAGSELFEYNSVFSDPRKVVPRIISILFPAHGLSSPPLPRSLGEFHPGFGGYAGYSSIREMLNQVLDTTGIEGLHLDDKPWLRERILDFYKIEIPTQAG